MGTLGLCAGCDRHARVGAPCPFCGGDIAELRERFALGRSSRAALLALAAVAPATLADCRRNVTMYGGPPQPLPSVSAAASISADPIPTPAINVPDAAPTMATPMYGMPPPHPKKL